MKIAVFITGAFEYSVALVHALSQYCEVDLYCSKIVCSKKDESILEVLNKNVSVNIFSDYRLRDLRNSTFYYSLCKNIVGRSYDILHIQGEGTPWFLFYRNIWRALPLVLTVHDPVQHPGLPFLNSVYQDVIQRAFIRIANKIIVHGRSLKKQVLFRYPQFNENNVHVLPHGTFSIYRQWSTVKDYFSGKSNSNNTILFFGSNRPNKGLQYLIKAEQILRSKLQNYKIVLAGENVSDCGLTDGRNSSHFEIVDEFIPTEKVPHYFRDASIVVLPYISATQSGIIPLAYAFGKPVVATNVGAIPEIVEEGKTGLLVEPGDEVALADAICSMLSDSDRLKRMSYNAFRYSEDVLSWDSIAKETLKIYEKAASVTN